MAFQLASMRLAIATFQLVLLALACRLPVVECDISSAVQSNSTDQSSSIKTRTANISEPMTVLSTEKALFIFWGFKITWIILAIGAAIIAFAFLVGLCCWIWCIWCLCQSGGQSSESTSTKATYKAPKSRKHSRWSAVQVDHQRQCRPASAANKDSVQTRKSVSIKASTAKNNPPPPLAARKPKLTFQEWLKKREKMNAQGTIPTMSQVKLNLPPKDADAPS